MKRCTVFAVLLLVFAAVLVVGQSFGNLAPATPAASKPAVTQIVVAPPKVDPLVKYAACVGTMNRDNFRTISQAIAMADRLTAEGFDVKRVVCTPQQPPVVPEGVIPVTDMRADGYPLDFPFNAAIESSRHSHSVAGLETWVNSGLWNWGLKALLRWYW